MAAQPPEDPGPAVTVENRSQARWNLRYYAPVSAPSCRCRVDAGPAGAATLSRNGDFTSLQPGEAPILRWSSKASGNPRPQSHFFALVDGAGHQLTFRARVDGAPGQAPRVELADWSPGCVRDEVVFRIEGTTVRILVDSLPLAKGEVR